MPFVEILLPTGHREKCEITSNTLLMTVLEDVCIKRGLIYDRCYLTYNKNKVDLSLKFGMSRLLNNAKLELVESPNNLIDSPTIDVAVQFADSSRFNYIFCPNVSFFTIMETVVKLKPELHSCVFPDDDTLTPVIVHLHEQIVGEYNLKNTTLASLGLRSGRVLFRMEFKNVSKEDILIFDEATRTRIEKYARGEEIRLRKAEERKVTERMTHAAESTVQQESVPPMPVTDMANVGESSFNDFTPFSAFQSGNKSMFDDHSKRQENVAQKKQSQTLGELLGINLQQDDQRMDCVPQSQDFLNFKFPEKTDTEKQTDERTENGNVNVCTEDRESVLYLHKPVSYSTTAEDVPDTFFELTEHDLRSIIQSYRNVVESDSPLMTSTTREHMREMKFSKYQRCIIQFQFQDAYILQSVFRPRETVGDLYNFVEHFFGVKSSDFHLYTSPPKDILKNKESNLIQGGLVPMCKVYVSVNANDLSTDVDQFLSGDAVKAREIVNKWMKTDDGPSSAPGASSQDRHTKSNSGNAHKTPKWFKSGK